MQNTINDKGSAGIADDSIREHPKYTYRHD